MYGLTPLLYTWSITGDIVKNVINRAKPIKIWLLGSVLVPKARLTKLRTMIILVKLVIIINIDE